MIIDIEITGVTPLLMNRFNEDDLSNKKRDKHLTPREEATKTAYLDQEGKLYYPPENIYACIIEAGKFHKDGKNKITTMKSSLIPAGVMIIDKVCRFTKPDLFEVDSRSVVVPSTGGRIMKRRAKLDEWITNFSIELDIQMFSPRQMREIVDDAGKKVGLGDYRPSRKGIFGRFVVTKWEEKGKAP